MKHLGDITKVNGAEIEPIPGIMWAADVLTGRKPFPVYKPQGSITNRPNKGREKPGK